MSKWRTPNGAWVSLVTPGRSRQGRRLRLLHVTGWCMSSFAASADPLMAWKVGGVWLNLIEANGTRRSRSLNLGGAERVVACGMGHLAAYRIASPPQTSRGARQRLAKRFSNTTRRSGQFMQRCDAGLLEPFGSNSCAREGANLGGGNRARTRGSRFARTLRPRSPTPTAPEKRSHPTICELL